jgi:topoisomerase-4 subunit A
MKSSDTLDSDPPRPAGGVLDTLLSEALSERYLAYALATITSRSLPDVRDGLKPVHRRLLYAMRLLKLDPGQGFKKCARVVGDVMGKYHPHGDQSIYDAMVRLAQEFSVRYPLVDGQGNFGNIDGDNAAAMRYTEARLTEVADALLKGLDEDSVDFRDTYDGEENEPVVLPAAFPNLLANGATGIAVGMATSIPPHNAGELCTAALHLIKAPNASLEKLIEIVPGPDFPTGGVMVEPRANVIAAYKTGRGGFRLRARWETEKTGRGQYQIVITEMPYQVQKARLIEKIAELIIAKKLPMLGDIRDESADDVRLVLEPRSRAIEPEALMETLFRLTDLEIRFPLNLNVLAADGTPGVMNLRTALQAFLDHRHVVLVRRSEHRLGKIEHRLEVLGGYLIAYLNLDELIRIIREEDEVKAALMTAFSLSDVQAEAILNMRLRSLRRLEEEGIRREHRDLIGEQKGLKALLGDKDQRWKTIAGEIRETRNAFGAKTELGKRRTLISDAPDVVEVPMEALVEREPITVICSDKGWIRAVKGHVEVNGEVKYKEGDHARFWFHAETTDKLVLFATNGRFYTLACDKLPRGRGHGEPLRLLTGLGNDQDIIDLMVHEPARKLVVASSDGRGFIVPEEQVIAQTRAGKVVLNVSGDCEARALAIIPEGADAIACIGDNRKLSIFDLADLPEMGRGRGVVLQRYKDGGLSDIRAFKRTDGLTWAAGVGRTRTENDLRAWEGKRAQAGRLAPRGFAAKNRFS